MFSDRPYRIEMNKPTKEFVEKFDMMFGDDLPNAAITFVSEDGEQFTGPIVVTLSDPQMTSDGTISYNIEQSRNQDGVLSILSIFEHGSSVHFTDCSLFIDGYY